MKVRNIKLTALFAAPVLIAGLLFGFTGCDMSTGNIVQDESPVRLYVALAGGNTKDYFEKLKVGIEEDLGIDIEFIYRESSTATELTRMYFKNKDLPADIIFTASKTDDEILKDSCVDLLAKSKITSLFDSAKVRECTTSEGAVYQLPVSSKLIGITVNETLLNEMGWSYPENFEDMVELKEKLLCSHSC